MMRYYELDESGAPQPIGNSVTDIDPEKFNKIWSDDHRRIDQEERGDVLVSTVFLALDHSFMNDSEPVLFETMVFGGEHDQHQERCGGNADDARAMHKRVVDMVFQ